MANEIVQALQAASALALLLTLLWLAAQHGREGREVASSRVRVTPHRSRTVLIDPRRTLVDDIPVYVRLDRPGPGYRSTGRA